jgi:LysM repeat protein
MDYRTQSGDTLSSIAAKFDVSLAALEAANPQIPDPDLIFPNELVHVPSGTGSPPTHTPMPVPPHVVTYIVQSGDTKSGIAGAHGLSLGALEAANPQIPDPDVIHPGQLINIPGGEHQPAHTPSAPRLAGGTMAISDVRYHSFDGGGNVASWTESACDVIGVPALHWVAGYQVLCSRESSGRANAINDWDSNAHGPLQADGYPLHCSRGVAQCIPDTFAANHVAGTTAEIYDPVANIAASMHYVMNRYDVFSDGSNLAREVQQADPNRSPRGY